MRETSFTIRSTQVDTFGHLNNAAYLEIFEWARWEWAGDSGMGILQLATERRIGPAVLHVDLSFFKELRMHEVIRVRTWMQQIEGVKGIIGQEMEKADGAIASRMWMTFVMFQLDQRRAVAMPPELEAAFRADEDYRRQRHEAEREVEQRRSQALRIDG